jgi:hypothetical protein
MNMELPPTPERILRVYSDLSPEEKVLAVLASSEHPRDIADVLGFIGSDGTDIEGLESAFSSEGVFQSSEPGLYEGLYLLSPEQKAALSTSVDINSVLDTERDYLLSKIPGFLNRHA